ncbi:MAG: Na/Pi cotransporter family protein [Clostridia bacterium]|nr:Na/Pi cotransporter family protein [Clostridia bacterium]
MLFSFLGGLGLFLFGIKSMSEGLQATAGDRLRLILEKGTRTPFRGVITGTLVTALIQSSSGTTVLTVGLVNAGLLRLRQAIGVIMGANIGTTITAYLIGFKLSDYALPVIALGVLLLFFFKNKRVNYLGQILFGFGLLFYGMDVMGEGMRPLRNSSFFIGLMSNVEHNAFLGVFIGTIFTAVVQSSSATIGVLQELANQGVVTYFQAVPILFGDNIGTTITAILASLGASVAARRTALTHLLFNVIGTCIFLPLFYLGIFTELVRLFTDFIYVLLPGFDGTWETLNIKMQIAQTHGFFNISNTIIQLPFVGLLATIVSKLVPGEESTIDTKPQYLEPRLLGNAPVAIANASRELLRMGRIASETFNYAVDFLFTQNQESLQMARQFEDAVDRLETEITNYTLKATGSKKLSDELSRRSYVILQVVGDLERVGDHSDNLLELTEYAIENNVKFSEIAQEDLKKMIKEVKGILAKSLEALKTENKQLAQEVVANDDLIDQMEKDLRRSHIIRLNEGACSGNASTVFLGILSNLERIGDHAVNIAEYVLGER